MELPPRHLNQVELITETVQGLWMAWIGSRLWVARGRQLFASDIFDPLHFNETTYIGGGGSFQAMDGDIMNRTRQNCGRKISFSFYYSYYRNSGWNYRQSLVAYGAKLHFYFIPRSWMRFANLFLQ